MRNLNLVGLFIAIGAGIRTAIAARVHHVGAGLIYGVALGLLLDQLRNAAALPERQRPSRYFGLA